MRALAMLVPLLVVAGCVTPPALEPDPDATLSSIIPWTLNECRYIVGWSQADPAVIQANLPEGFTVQTGGPVPLGLPVPAPGPAQRAIIGTEAFECASGSGLNGTLEPMTYSSIWIPVVPPDTIDVGDAGAVYYKIHVLVPDAPRRDAMTALGLSVGNGEIAWTQPPTPGSRGSAFSVEGSGDFAFELLAPREVGASEGSPFMEITPAGELGADGFAIWNANYAWNEDTFVQGSGTITWPSGHWVTEAIGAERAPGTFHAGVWSFNGTLELPRGN